MVRINETRRSTAAITALLLATPPWFPVLAVESETPQAEERESPGESGRDGEEESSLFERLKVVGSAASKLPGAVTVVDEEELRKQGYSDIHRILRLVPGVNLQEEEGFGLRPNIGMRGSGVERSSKITLLEDGVLIAPAPYAAPAAYYFPTAGRMESVEVRKGSSSIRQGPFTNGGALNLISSSIPSALAGSVNLAVASDDTFQGRARIGDSTPRFGWLAETFRLRSDGFKRLDGGGPTGLELTDYLVKFRVTSAAAAETFQALEIKLGQTEQSGEETYLGLTQQDFEQNPYRRYAASREDRLDTDHDQVQLSYLLRPNRHFDLTATMYRNDFFRNWRKLQSVEDVSISSVLDAPGSFKQELAILRGDVDSDPGALALRNNRRSYYAQGVQMVLGIHARSGPARQEIELGLRYHEDEEDRFQEEDRFRMIDGKLELTTVGDPGSQSNRISRAKAWAFFAQDRLSFNRWTVTPGVRVELIDFRRLDFADDDPERSGTATRRDNDVREVIPGVGVHYQLSPAAGLFAGIHRGFAPPGPGADERTDAEESVNYELGYRRNSGQLGLQAVGFFNDYDNLLGSDTLSSGGAGSGEQFNGGAAEVRGLELGLDCELAPAGSRFVMPLTLAYTYTQAEFGTSFETGFEGWGPEVRAGDDLPYLPPHQASLGLGWLRGAWSVFGNLAYSDRMRTRPGQGRVPRDEATDAHLLVDLTVSRELREGLSVRTQIRNLTDEAYVAARRPAGARPGLPRYLLVGVSWDF